MGKGPERKVDRDKNLILDYKSQAMLDGTLTMSDLVAKYNISEQRIRQILKHYNIPANHPKKGNKK